MNKEESQKLNIEHCARPGLVKTAIYIDSQLLQAFPPLKVIPDDLAEKLAEPTYGEVRGKDMSGREELKPMNDPNPAGLKMGQDNSVELSLQPSAQNPVDGGESVERMFSHFTTILEPTPPVQPTMPKKLLQKAASRTYAGCNMKMTKPIGVLCEECILERQDTKDLTHPSESSRDKGEMATSRCLLEMLHQMMGKMNPERKSTVDFALLVMKWRSILQDLPFRKASPEVYTYAKYLRPSYVGTESDSTHLKALNPPPAHQPRAANMEEIQSTSELVSKIAVPASTATPTAATTPQPISATAIQISIPPPSVAEDESLVSVVRDIVNAVYHETEGDLFVPGYQRTKSPQVATLIRKGQLALAYLDDRDSQSHASSTEAPITAANIVGCVCIKRTSERLGEFGMLALDIDYRGGGTGRRMAQFAEDHCRAMGCSSVQIEILVPTTFEHAFKARLFDWYQRMGYEVVRLGNFGDDWPELAAQLAGPTDYRILEKKLL
ncbi:hypothetical protein HJFPF1_05582 [Paramyrothecium foliicola]|nr:hypothetical protein HJFPF1_05582 [Paramyrothecium foliicola]